VFLLLVNIFLLIVGCFMETIAAITILVPVFMPIVAKLGIDPVHFGLIMVLNLMIGLLTPPVGMVLFILQKVSGLSFEQTVKAVVPWLWPLLATLALITYVPQLVLWLPGILYK
jgi:TRAP-type C4-dicarboxylate transport system permease large subunit